jgi:hypothetical protein
MELADLPPDGRPIGDPLWTPWTPAEVTERLDGVEAPWCVAGGWAIDLFAGEVSRPHEDIEIAVPAASFPAIRSALPELEFHVVAAGHAWPVDSAAFAVTHQTWGCERRSGAYCLDVFREPHDGDIWICRRDESIRLPYGSVIRQTGDGIPYLAPQIVLLFKARNGRRKDSADLAVTLPRLAADDRDWLAWALRLVHPGHRWIAEVSAS